MANLAKWEVVEEEDEELLGLCSVKGFGRSKASSFTGLPGPREAILRDAAALGVRIGKRRPSSLSARRFVELRAAEKPGERDRLLGLDLKRSRL